MKSGARKRADGLRNLVRDFSQVDEINLAIASPTQYASAPSARRKPTSLSAWKISAET